MTIILQYLIDTIIEWTRISSQKVRVIVRMYLQGWVEECCRLQIWLYLADCRLVVDKMTVRYGALCVVTAPHASRLL